MKNILHVKHLFYFLNIAFLGIFLLFFAGCEKTPSGIIDDNSMPPFLSFAQLNRDSLNIDEDSLYVIPLDSGKKFFLTLFATATAHDTDGGNSISFLHYKIFKPNTSASMQSGKLKRTSVANSSATFSDSIVFVVQRTEPGFYQFQFTAEDNKHWISNAFLLSFLVTRRNSTPNIDTVVTPDSIQIPSAGAKFILFTATVSDSDGIGDIANVFFKNLTSSNPTNIPLFDDGLTSEHGDQLAGDGIFSRMLFIDSSNTPGDKEFRFYAKDKSNAIDSLSKFISIHY
jgi:hypothetical protein